MENQEISTLLEETADLMEVAGEDGFRIRSYRNAARAVDNLTERIEDILGDESRKLTDLPSIGKTMAGHIVEMCRTGKLGVREELAESIRP